MNRREKRSEIIRARVTPSLRLEIEQALREEGSVITMSDWLFEAAEERLAMRAIRVSKQRLGRRVAEA
jgi:hypothetical protein